MSSGIGIAPQSLFYYTTNFALTRTPTTLASQTVTVPPGMTSAVVTVVSRLAAVNSTGSADYLSCMSKISGAGGLSLQRPVSSGYIDFNVSAYSVVLPGLVSGGTILLEVQGNTTAAGWAANAANTAEMTGSILWFR